MVYKSIVRTFLDEEFYVSKVIDSHLTPIGHYSYFSTNILNRYQCLWLVYDIKSYAHHFHKQQVSDFDVHWYKLAEVSWNEIFAAVTKPIITENMPKNEALSIQFFWSNIKI